MAKDSSAPEAAPGQLVSAPSVANRSTTTLLSAKIFECYSPPPVNTLTGALLPRGISKRRRRRKVSIEVHRVENFTGIELEECIVRVLDPVSDEERRAAEMRAKTKLRRLHDEAASVLSTAGDGDDESTAGVPAEFLDATSTQYVLANYDKGWKAKYRFPLKAISIKGTHKTGVLLQIEMKSTKQVRELVFDSQEEAEEFESALKSELAKEQGRNQARMRAALGGAKIKTDEVITFLVEIVSAWDIPAGDYYYSDPYVVCYFNLKEIHRTSYISKTLDPIWTIKTGSLFLFSVASKELFMSDGLVFNLCDYDKFGENEDLGVVTVSPKELYGANGERMEFKLKHPQGKDEPVSGSLAIRCRRATDYDKKFMEDYSKADQKQFALLYKAMAEGKAGAGNLKSIMTKRTRIATSGENAGKKEYKIRPGPDPNRREETSWMTKEQIEEESLKPSLNWIDAGSGPLGRLFIEVIGCHDLPQMDIGGFAGNLTDAFASIVYEDAVVRTDVIDDCLDPRWLPWTQRAFIFHMYHSSSQIFVGVFDHDSGSNPADDHDPIGRVTVDISNLRRNTVYVMKFNLYTSARMSQRESKGSITLRLRIEIFDERKVLLANLEPPPNFYVNAKTRRDFRVLRYTCVGKFDTEQYNLRVINAYIEELLALRHVLFYIQDAAISLFLWRGTLPITLDNNVIVIPVHSMTAFVWAVLLVEHPQLVPCFFFGGFAWLMLAINGFRRSLPDKWLHCKSFYGFIEILLLGQSQAGTHAIEKYQNYEQTKALLEAWTKRVAEAEEEAAKQQAQAIKEQEAYEREMEEVGDQNFDISTKGGGVSIDPLRYLLFPVQQYLAIVCRYIRLVKYIIMWEECYISFWITLACLVLALVFFFVPWFFVIKWSSRIVAWTLFGPWMKLVDIYYVSKIKPLTEEEKKEKERKDDELRILRHSENVAAARVRRENAAKLKAMKKYMFGKFIVRIPVLKEDRYRDHPLPESYAIPFYPDARSLSELAMDEVGYRKVRLPGQHLEGDMIPKAETVVFTEAPTGQAIAKPALLRKEDPGMALVSGPESTAAAYATIMSLVITAGILTWLGVPLLAAGTKFALKSV